MYSNCYWYETFTVHYFVKLFDGWAHFKLHSNTNKHTLRSFRFCFLLVIILAIYWQFKWNNNIFYITNLLWVIIIFLQKTNSLDQLKLNWTTHFQQKINQVFTWSLYRIKNNTFSRLLNLQREQRYVIKIILLLLKCMIKIRTMV